MKSVTSSRGTVNSFQKQEKTTAKFQSKLKVRDTGKRTPQIRRQAVRKESVESKRLGMRNTTDGKALRKESELRVKG